MPTVYKADDIRKPFGHKPKQRHVPYDCPPLKPLASFAEHPNNVKFETQEEEETVELFLRQHPIVNVPWIFLSGILFIVPLIAFPLIYKSFISSFILPHGFIIIGILFWYVAAFGFVLTNLIHWFFNIYIVSNERIVDIDFLYLLYKKFSIAELTKIQDLSYTTSGILAAMFNYGNVYVQTAGEMPNIEFDRVPNPRRVVERIRELAEEVGQEES